MHTKRTTLSAAALAAALMATGPAHAIPEHVTTSPASPPAPVTGRVIEVRGVDTLPTGESDTLRTARLRTSRFETLGVTWPGDETLDIDVRTYAHGSWSRWRSLHPMDEHAPDIGTSGSATATDRSATEPVWVGPSTGLQVHIAGHAPRRARLVLVDPRTLPTDTSSTPSPRLPTASLDPTRAPQPRIRSRRAWGARESWRTGRPRYTTTIKQAHIHHTAGTNRYTRADVPAIIRGDYWYHTQVLGWSDLGYNFVVDKFGRIWEGRAGGVQRPVLGAHTLGFNHVSFGVAAIGNFSRARPRSGLVGALVRLTAWKLDKYGRRPAGRTVVTSSGSDRYRRGQTVVLRVIDGHRDTNQTACPGDRLYAKLPTIRKRAQQRADAIFLPGPLGG